MRNLKLHWHRLLNTKTVTIDGLKICTDKNKTPKFVRSSLFKGTHEAHERRMVAKYLNEDDRVLEIGAATGLISMVCAKHCGANNVLSYEANPAMEKMIRENFSLNGWEPNLVMKAVTLDGSDISFFVSENIYSSSMIDRSETVRGKTIIVPSDPIDKVISEFKPTTIVMDVEGAEIELLGEADVSGVTKIIVEVHPHVTGQDSVERLVANLENSGFGVVTKAHKTIYFEKAAG